MNKGEIVLQHCRTEGQFADILTKPLGQKSFNYLRKCLGMKKNPTVENKGECWNLIPTAARKGKMEKLSLM